MGSIRGLKWLPHRGIRRRRAALTGLSENDYSKYSIIDDLFSGVSSRARGGDSWNH